ncbi:MAG: 30S ribosomal protein S24e [Euryarchaeota archaeon]|nr:30S ribosomal protein S24e [Euryarchaeota archaeon]
MEIEIESKKNNPLLNRTEVHFVIRHTGEGTPRREVIRGELAGKLGVGKENIIIDHMTSDFGIQKTKGYAKVYSSAEKTKAEERNHLLKRNNLPMKKEEKKKEKPGEGAAKKQKPAEAKPEPKKAEPQAPAEKKE